MAEAGNAEISPRRPLLGAALAFAVGVYISSVASISVWIYVVLTVIFALGAMFLLRRRQIAALVFALATVASVGAAYFAFRVHSPPDLPASEPVLVKVFARNHLPPVLQPAFSRPGVSGVTIDGRYIAILQTEFRKEYEDILGHELVHAYVSLVSPKPLPFWFQEGGAVHLSMGKGRKFYGQPSKTEAHVTVGRVVELDPT